MAAGFVYSRGSAGADGLAEDAQYMTFPAGLVERYAPTDFIVFYENWPAFQLFEQCVTQWRFTPTGQKAGLDYTAVIALATVRGCADTQTLENVRNLELGALACHYGKTLEFITDG